MTRETCSHLTVSDSGKPLELDTRWSVYQPGRMVVTGLISPRGLTRFVFASTPCLACGHPASDHASVTRHVRT